MFTRTEIVDRVMAAGIPDRRAAERAITATLIAVGQRLTDDEAQALGAFLPSDLARRLDQCEYEGAFDADGLYDRVRRRAHIGEAAVRENVDMVLGVVGGILDDGLRRRLARALPAPLGERLEPREIGRPPEHPAHPHAPALATLAHGRPGSRHPLSEAAPVRAHAHSVAASPEPHSETRLSSARGMTQERLRESLASGRPPGPERPIADASDE